MTENMRCAYVQDPRTINPRPGAKHIGFFPCSGLGLSKLLTRHTENGPFAARQATLAGLGRIIMASNSNNSNNRHN